MEVMTKQKPPRDPVKSASEMVRRFTNTAPPNGERVFQMLNTVLVVRAIDRLTAAVKANTEALAAPRIRHLPYGDATDQAERDFAE
jgi:hypothetical protein